MEEPTSDDAVSSSVTDLMLTLPENKPNTRVSTLGVVPSNDAHWKELLHQCAPWLHAGFLVGLMILMIMELVGLMILMIMDLGVCKKMDLGSLRRKREVFCFFFF